MRKNASTRWVTLKILCSRCSKLNLYEFSKNSIDKFFWESNPINFWKLKVFRDHNYHYSEIINSSNEDYRKQEATTTPIFGLWAIILVPHHRAVLKNSGDLTADGNVSSVYFNVINLSSPEFMCPYPLHCVLQGRVNSSYFFC